MADIRILEATERVWANYQTSQTTASNPESPAAAVLREHPIVPAAMVSAVMKTRQPLCQVTNER
eukprot:6773633-Pyramimonas_sp.AAC.1